MKTEKAVDCGAGFSLRNTLSRYTGSKSRRGDRGQGEGSLQPRSTSLFTCSWDRAVFLHYQVDPHILQQQIPFPLDLFDSNACVSLVAFTLRDLRFNHPHLGWLTHPLRTHDFLNVRTYVRQGPHRGIYFLAEWLNNRLASFLGPILYGLPYRFGTLTYSHNSPKLSGQIVGGMGSGTPMPVRSTLRYSGKLPDKPSFQPCAPASLDHFLLERYTAFTQHGRCRRLFHVSHTPWPQTQITATILDSTLLHTTGPWFSSAQLISAHFSPGVDVEMGSPQTLRSSFKGLDNIPPSYSAPLSITPSSPAPSSPPPPADPHTTPWR